MSENLYLLRRGEYGATFANIYLLRRFPSLRKIYTFLDATHGQVIDNQVKSLQMSAYAFN